MNGFLLTLLDMSLVSSFLILAVLFLRFVCKRAPKAIICLLWALVGIRLLCPFTFESPLSLVPESEPITYIAQKAEENDTAVKGVEKINRDVVSYDTAEGFALDKENSQHFETYRYVLDGKVYDNLPDKAVFTDGFVLKTE